VRDPGYHPTTVTIEKVGKPLGGTDRITGQKIKPSHTLKNLGLNRIRWTPNPEPDHSTWLSIVLQNFY
jgi:hypothetical protein